MKAAAPVDYSHAYRLHKQADVSCNDAPAFVKLHPGLALAAGLWVGLAIGVAPAKLDVCSGAMIAVGGDHGFEHFAREALARSRRSKCGDLIEAVEVFADTVAQGVWATPKQAIQYLHLVVDQGVFVLVEGGGDLLKYGGFIDVHIVSRG